MSWDTVWISEDFSVDAVEQLTSPCIAARLNPDRAVPAHDSAEP